MIWSLVRLGYIYIRDIELTAGTRILSIFVQLTVHYSHSRKYSSPDHKVDHATWSCQTRDTDVFYPLVCSSDAILRFASSAFAASFTRQWLSNHWSLLLRYMYMSQDKKICYMQDKKIRSQLDFDAIEIISTFVICENKNAIIFFLIHIASHIFFYLKKL